MADLCDVTPLAETTCCDPAPAADLGPITNPPARSSLRYRLGTFASFRRALLASIPRWLPQWRDRGRRDYGVVLLEMWATLADILTFYQERIANEAFLRPAVLRESVARLAALVDYRLNPGAAANIYLAFTADPGKSVTLPAGFRAQTKPAPGAGPVPFETDDPLTAFASLNLLRVQSLQDQTLGFGDPNAVILGTETKLKAGDRVLIVGAKRHKDPGSEEWEIRRVSRVLPDKTTNITRIAWKEPLGHRLPRVDSPAGPQLYALRRQAWPFGSNAPDYQSLKSTTTQTVGSTTTTITTRPALPDWTGETLPEDPTRRDYIFLDSLYPTIVADSWIVLVTGESVEVPDESGLGSTTYPQGYAEVYRVLQVDETVHSNYTLNSKVTRLKVDTVKQKRQQRHAKGRPISGQTVTLTQAKNIDIFPMKGTSVLAQSEKLTLAQVPISTPVAGDTLTLDAVYSDLKPGRLLIISGKAPGGTPPQTEVATVKSVANPITGTVVTLAANLAYRYDPSTVSLYGNVVAASQGETTAGEILGSGDAAQLFQAFTLKKKPLTFLRATGPDANRWGTRAALQVRAGGALWKEKDNLLNSGPADRDYTLSVGAEDGATIMFGSGEFEADAQNQPAGAPVLGGARLPTGRDNVHARYRKGLGTQGNVATGAVSTLVSTAPGLKSVFNPLQGTGGADREREDKVKVNVPAALRAFDRAVSLEDYAALARTYSGVAKARAFWERRDPSDPTGRRRLEQPRISLTVAATDRTPPLQPVFKAALRAFLDTRRDPNQPLVIADFTPISVHLAIQVEPDPDLLPEKVLADVATALSAARNPDGSYGLFAFERLDFGLSLHLSDIYAVVQGVPGVNAARITRFRHHARLGEFDGDIPEVETHIFIRNTEILRCENDPADPTLGTLTLTAGEVSNAA